MVDITFQSFEEGALFNILLPFEELVVHRLLYEDSSCRYAVLSLVEEDAAESVLYRLVPVTVREQDERRLSAQLEGDLLQVGHGTRLHYNMTNLGGAGETQLTNKRVVSDGLENGTRFSEENKKTFIQ